MTQKMDTQAARIGALKGEILAHAVPVEVLGVTGTQRQMPKNSSSTIKFRRWLPYATLATNADTQNRMVTGDNVDTYAQTHETQEGVTPSADSLTAVDVTVTLKQYACLYGLTDQVEDLYEDDVASEMRQRVGERVGLIREMVRYGALKAMTNVHYANGSTKNGVDSAFTLNSLRKITRNLKANHAKMITSILAPSPNFATAPVEAGYLVFCHTDMEPVIRDLPGFKHTSEYGQRKVINEHEIGSVESFRFILSPELAPDYAAGGTAATNNVMSNNSADADLYPIIVAAEDAWGSLALRGENSLSPTYIRPGERSKSDPLGQRGYIGAKFYMAAKMLNDGWAALLWSATPNL